MFNNLKYFLSELKFRILYLIISYALTLLIIFNYKFEILYLLSKSILVTQKNFIYTGIADLLYIYIYISFLISFVISLPFFIYILSFFYLKSMYNYKIIYFTILYFLIILTILLLSKLILTKGFPQLFLFLNSFYPVKDQLILPLYLEPKIDEFILFMFKLWFLGIVLLIIFITLIAFYLILINKKLEINNLINLKKYYYLFSLAFFIIIVPPDLFLQIIFFPIYCLLIEIILYWILFFIFIYKRI